MAKVAIPRLGIRAQSVSVRIAAHLEQLIALGELNAGDRLPSERDLAADLRVSRASLREAMHELEAKQLVERKPGRGTLVLGPPRQAHDLYAHLSDVERELRDIAELRETVEPQIARLAAARATDANLVELEDVLNPGVAGLTPDDSVTMDVQFHLLLAQASRNPLLTSLCSLTSSWTRPVRAFSHATRQAREVSHRGHLLILDAVRKGDSDTAGTAMLQHLHEVSALTQRNYTA